MTQLASARNRAITPLMKQVAAGEGIDTGALLTSIRDGRVVIPANKTRRVKKPCGIGQGLRTKVNVNIGTSPDRRELVGELNKLQAAVEYGADTVMDLSVGGDLSRIRQRILETCVLPVGTVPIYGIAVEAQEKKGHFLNFSAGDVFTELEAQAREGVDFFTIHAGVTRKSLAELSRHKRVMDIVSRGGAILASWIKRHNRENPFYEYFDRILDIAFAFDVTLSLGDGLRPGSVLDATDAGQIAELKVLGELTLRARRKQVQVIIEGPGHVPLNQIKKNVLLEKELCHNAPFYVLGPLVTDVAAGYDHISAAIGGALAASYGADFLCYVTPAEHLRHPSLSDVKEGIVASRIAAHAADIAKGLPGAISWDERISRARKKRDWKRQLKLCLDPVKARAYRQSSQPAFSDACTMCGQYCSMKVFEDCLTDKGKRAIKK